jgi:hypothetical protein
MAETISHGWWLDDEKLKAFEALVRADEREQIIATQPAPVQPVAIALNTGTKQGVKWLKNVEHGEKLYTTPPAQPAPVQELTNIQRHEQNVQKFLAAQPAPVQEPVPDYAWPTVADYEKDVGFEVNDAFKMAWAMARTTNALFTQLEKP